MLLHIQLRTLQHPCELAVSKTGQPTQQRALKRKVSTLFSFARLQNGKFVRGLSGTEKITPAAWRKMRRCHRRKGKRPQRCSFSVAFPCPPGAPPSTRGRKARKQAGAGQQAGAAVICPAILCGGSLHSGFRR